MTEKGIPTIPLKVIKDNEKKNPIKQTHNVHSGCDYKQVSF